MEKIWKNILLLKKKNRLIYEMTLKKKREDAQGSMTNKLYNGRGGA